jgi:hypothetical protein
MIVGKLIQCCNNESLYPYLFNMILIQFDYNDKKKFYFYNADLFLFNCNESLFSCFYNTSLFQSGLSHRTSFGKITSERPRVRTNVRVGQPPVDGPWRTVQADGQSCGRAHSHPTEKQPGIS